MMDGHKALRRPLEYLARSSGSRSARGNGRDVSASDRRYRMTSWSCRLRRGVGRVLAMIGPRRFGCSDHDGGGQRRSHLRLRPSMWMRIAAGVIAGAISTLQPAQAVDVSSLPSRPSFDLPVGEGRILRFDRAVDSVYIADTTIADLKVVSPDVVYVYGKKSGTTNLIALSADQRIQASVEFSVGIDNAPVNKAKRELRPTSTMDIVLFGDRAGVKGNARSVEEAVDVASVAQTYSPPGQPPINNTTIDGSQQVNIRVRFAEVSRSDLHSVGLDWNQILENASTISFGRAGNDNAVIDGLRRSGILTILAEPNLTAVTGQTASFLAGGEIPVPYPGGPNGQIAIQYKPFGVSLEFTPTLIRTNRIGLRVRPEVSTISQVGAVKTNGFDIPSFVVRRADSTLEMASGETYAMAGLFQREMSPDVALKFPIIGDLPIIGALFQSERYRRNETELVILITPYLVKPVRDRGLATPLDRPSIPPPPAVTAAIRPSHAARPYGLILK
jgi:pilus assembly protein CpaC